MESEVSVWSGICLLLEVWVLVLCVQSAEFRVILVTV